MPFEPSINIQYLKSVGPKRAESFAKVGIKTIRDLLFYMPYKHLDRANILTSSKVLQYVINGYNGEVTIIGEVINKELIRYGRKQILKVKFKDNNGFYEGIWFQGIRYFSGLFNKGEFYAISAKPVITKYGNLQFVHPDFDRLGKNETDDFLHTGKIIPFYRIPKELKESNLGDFSLRKIIHYAVEHFSDQIEESMPEYIIQEKKLLDIKQTIKNIHFPQNFTLLEKARERLKFEEMFYFECLVAIRKNFVKSTITGIPFQIKAEPIKKFLKRLPFELTKDQLHVLSEIRKDLESKKPMNRLLQGDVGSGKTIVALISMIIVKYNGYQSVLMAPTEILADQHYKKICQLISDSDIKVVLLIGGQSKKERATVLDKIKTGDADIIIGTHALIEENVVYHKLGLVVIDEQHRFGVVQRARLIEKGFTPNVLVMTATPIPRTLSMTLYGDLDISYIKEMPANRKPVKTYIRSEKKLPEVYNFIKAKAKEGCQTFLVYPLIEESEKLELKAAETYFNQLKQTYLSDLKVSLIHGRMNWKEKEEIMLKFARKEFDVLISTTVIEVGIDIPSANIIVINDAFRFGLSQLHQLRGRVGRSIEQGYCILITKDEYDIKMKQYNFDFEYMSPAQIEKYKSIIRLNAMIKYADGFKLSEIDLKLRGPGDIFGTKQSGLPELKYTDIINDSEIIEDAKQTAFNLIASDDKLRQEKNSVVRKTLAENYSSLLKLSYIV
ncbi:ATP-dependent DNA helicase RecG [Melioribacteraceae bacterium 4301-Me]|uniref:ATP-dependent DNA helicase RecG n=1 Tax=Pyranulibacter aquaticus TaxID=3163344 RepID=UPI0035997E2D